MADLPSVKSKIQDTEVFQDAELTTTLHDRYGSNINYLLDVVNDHETRLAEENQFIASRETPRVNFSNFYKADPGDEVAGNTITPATTKVLLVFSGLMQISSTDFTLTVKRNAVSIFSQGFGPSGIQNSSGSNELLDLSIMNFIDFGATIDALNTYSLELSVNSNIFHNPALQLIGRL